MMNDKEKLEEMNIDNNYECLLSSFCDTVVCGGNQISIEELLKKPAPNPQEFRSYLEYLLFKGAAFNVKKKHICNDHICSNHFKTLSSYDGNKGRCKTCKPVCQRRSSNNNGVRSISKVLALAIWERGQPESNWSFLHQPICDQCRKHIMANFVTDETRSKSQNIFDWLYDEDVFCTSVPSEPDDDKKYQCEIVGDGYDCSDETDDNDYDCFDEIDNVNKLKGLLKELGFTGRCESTLSYTSLKRKSQINFCNQAKKIFYHILKYLAPNDTQTVWDDIVHNDCKHPVNETSDAVMTAIQMAMENAEHYSTKRQLLALIAADFPASFLRTHFPTITDYQIKAARHHAYRYGRGAPVEEKTIHFERFNDEQISHFIEFISSPLITADLPFGVRKMKIETGEIIEIPNTCRNMIPTRIIRQYHNYCLETTNGEFKPLGFTSLIAILHACPASTRKSMAGIDEYSANGSTAFDSLSKLCDDLSSFQTSIEELEKLKKALQQSRNYIKIDYKMHISSSSTIPDHCSTYSLSDPQEQAWKTSCDHSHSDECQQCALLELTLSRIKDIIQCNANISDEMRMRFMKLFNQQYDSIKEWKKHQLRAAHQEAARDYALENLDEKSVFIVIDWAMKWLEKKYRQSQTEFFAMRGLPWHLTHVIRLQPSDKLLNSSEKLYQNRTFCHSFDNCIQNGAAVVSILQDVFIRLRQDHPEIETAFVRADNAGCYHGAETLLSVKELYKTTGILIRRVDFSEAQAGKGPCDRKAAVIKGEIRRYVNEKHDCTTSAEFVAAAKSTQHLSILSCSLPSTTQTSTKIKWDGIKKFNNIEFIPKTISTANIRSNSKPLVSASLPPTSSAPSSSSTASTTSSSPSVALSASSSPAAALTASSSFSSATTTSSSLPLNIETCCSEPSIDIEIKVWRAFGIGSGKTFKWSDLKSVQTITPLVIDSNAQHLNKKWKSEISRKEENVSEDESETEYTHSNAESLMDVDPSENTSINRHGFCLWECTHERCILQFRRRSDRDNHLDTGKHKFEPNHTSLLDNAKLLFKNRLDNDTTNKTIVINNFVISQNTDYSANKKDLCQGWALTSKKIQKRFNPNQKNYLVDAYNHGEVTGFKINPSTLSLEMTSVKENGKFRFTPEEWLTTKQIKSYFSTLTQARRQKSNSVNDTNASSQKFVLTRKGRNVKESFELDMQEQNVVRDYEHAEADTDDEEENEEDFDNQIINMDTEDMFIRAKDTLLNRQSNNQQRC